MKGGGGRERNDEDGGPVSDCIGRMFALLLGERKWRIGIWSECFRERLLLCRRQDKTNANQSVCDGWPVTSVKSVRITRPIRERPAQTFAFLIAGPVARLHVVRHVATHQVTAAESYRTPKKGRAAAGTAETYKLAGPEGFIKTNLLPSKQKNSRKTLLLDRM